MIEKAVTNWQTVPKRQSWGIWAVRLRSMSKQNGCLPLCESPDTFRLTKAFTRAHARTQTCSHNRCASVAFCLPFTDQDSTKAMHRPHAPRLSITFPLAAPDRPCHAPCGNCWKRPESLETKSKFRDGATS